MSSSKIKFLIYSVMAAILDLTIFLLFILLFFPHNYILLQNLKITY